MLKSRTDALERHFVRKIRLELRLLSVVKQGGVNFYALQMRRMGILVSFPNKHDCECLNFGQHMDNNCKKKRESDAL